LDSIVDMPAGALFAGVRHARHRGRVALRGGDQVAVVLNAKALPQAPV
jgi:hypothetical protein